MENDSKCIILLHIFYLLPHSFHPCMKLISPRGFIICNIMSTEHSNHTKGYSIFCLRLCDALNIRVFTKALLFKTSPFCRFWVNSCTTELLVYKKKAKSMSANHVVRKKKLKRLIRHSRAYVFHFTLSLRHLSLCSIKNVTSSKIDSRVINICMFCVWATPFSEPSLFAFLYRLAIESFLTIFTLQH